VVYVILLASAFAVLGEVYGDLLRAAGATERLMELLNTRSVVSSPAQPQQAPWPQSGSSVSLQALDFHYPSRPQTLALAGLSGEIHPGQTVAVVGPSGAGKTTMLRMLAGLLIPSKGSISIEPEFLYSSQSPYLFKGTIKENIIYSEQKIPDHIADEKVKDLIIALSLAYSESGSKIMMDKNLGFLGEGLSGGEKARVALARTLFVSPKLILLDEPTANLDAESAQLFWKAVHSWKNKDSEHTIVTVCHVLQEIKDFDLCYVFANGKIIPKTLFLF
jgi:ATP-binding cassette subfamily B protein